MLRKDFHHDSGRRFSARSLNAQFHSILRRRPPFSSVEMRNHVSRKIWRVKRRRATFVLLPRIFAFDTTAPQLLRADVFICWIFLLLLYYHSFRKKYFYLYFCIKSMSIHFYRATFLRFFHFTTFRYKHFDWSFLNALLCVLLELFWLGLCNWHFNLPFLVHFLNSIDRLLFFYLNSSFTLPFTYLTCENKKSTLPNQ